MESYYCYKDRQEFKAGHIYEGEEVAVNLFNSDPVVYIKVYPSGWRRSGVWFDTLESEGPYYLFKNYFMTKEELREKKIDTIILENQIIDNA